MCSALSWTWKACTYALPSILTSLVSGWAASPHSFWSVLYVSVKAATFEHSLVTLIWGGHQSCRDAWSQLIMAANVNLLNCLPGRFFVLRASGPLRPNVCGEQLHINLCCFARKLGLTVAATLAPGYQSWGLNRSHYASKNSLFNCWM